MIFLHIKADFSSVSHIELGVDGADVGMIHGDGIIVSSRLGSTGYSISPEVQWLRRILM